MTLDPNERHTDSSPGPPFIRPNDVTGSNEETRDDVEGPSGCHDLFVNVKQGGIQNGRCCFYFLSMEIAYIQLRMPIEDCLHLKKNNR